MYQVLCTAVRMIDLKVSRTSYVDIRTPFGTLCSHHVMNSIMRERQRLRERQKKAYPHTGYGGISCVHPVCLIYVVQYPAASRAGPINAQSTLSNSKHNIQVGRINLEPLQVTASKHWSPHSVRVGWYLFHQIKQFGCTYTLNTPIRA